MTKKGKTFSGVYIALMMLFLYLPIFVLIVFSFNSSKGYSWTGFSLKWYQDLFSNTLILNSLKNTLIVAAAASVISTILGTGAALGVFSMKNKAVKGAIKNVTYLPMLSPEIVTGISLMLLFSLAHMSGGFVSLIIAHVTFCVPTVFLSVLPKLRQINKNMYEAALDLGCNPSRAFFKVIVPEIMPGIITGFLMAFTYSLDDFVVSYFHYDLFDGEKARQSGNQRALDNYVRDRSCRSSCGECALDSGGACEGKENDEALSLYSKIYIF